MKRVKLENDRLLRFKEREKRKLAEKEIEMAKEYERLEVAKEAARKKKLEDQSLMIMAKMNRASDFLKAEEDKAAEDEARAEEHQRKKLLADEARERKRKEDASKRSAEVQLFLKKQIQKKKAMEKREQMLAAKEAAQLAEKLEAEVAAEEKKKADLRLRNQNHRKTLEEQMEHKVKLNRTVSLTYCLNCLHQNDINYLSLALMTIIFHEYNSERCSISWMRAQWKSR